MFSQKNTLQMRDVVDNIVLNNNYNEVEDIHIGNHKSTHILYFWSPEMINSYNFLNGLKSLQQISSYYKFKESQGLEITAIATECDYINWLTVIDSLELNIFRNLIVKKQYSETFWPNYNIKNVPLILVVNNNGIVDLVNPSMNTIINYLEARKSTSKSFCIAGKITESDLKKPYSNKKITFINEKKDTLSVTKTDNRGNFEISFVKSQSVYTLLLECPSKKNHSSFKLLNQNGKFVCLLKSTNNNVYSNEMYLLKSKPKTIQNSNLNKQSITFK